MKRQTHSEAQIIVALKNNKSRAKVAEICRKLGIFENTFYRWMAKYGGMEQPEAKRLHELEMENRKLKWLLTEAMLDNAALKDVVS